MIKKRRIPVLFENAWFYAPLFFVLLPLKKRIIAHSLATFFKGARAEKNKQKTCILKDHGYITAGIAFCFMSWSLICSSKTLPPSASAKNMAAKGKPIIFITSGLYDGNLGGAAGATQICQREAYQKGSIIPPGLSFSAIVVTAKHYPCDATGHCGGTHASESWPLKPSTAYYHPDGTIFNTVNKNAVFDGQHLILKAPTGASIINHTKIWSGSQSVLSNSSGSDIVAWAYADVDAAKDHEIYKTYSPTNCLDFTSNSLVKNGSAGEVGVASGSAQGVIPPNTWGNYFLFSNNNSAFLYNIWITSEVLLCGASAALVCVSY